MFAGAGERERYSKVPTYPDLAGKVAVVTGGSGGIGGATCRLLAANGVKVAINGRDEAKIGAVVDDIRSTGGEALGVAADCTDLAAVERMRERTEAELGPAGIVAAFAGGGIARPGPLAQTTEEEWHSTVDANLTATFLTLKSFLPGMIDREGGSIVTMASSAARFPTGAGRRQNKGGIMAQLIGNDELPNNGSVHKFEGYQYGDVDVSFFLLDTAPGKGPDLHRHPYDEVFVVQEGELTFTVGDATIEATGGQIVIAPAGAPHKFVNSGTGRARHIDIHTSRRMITDWLED